MGVALKRWLLWGAIGLLLAALAVYLFRPQAVPVDLVEVRAGPLSVAVTEEGRTRLKDVFEVSAPVDGRLRRVEVEPGDAARAGETVLAELEPAAPALLDIRSETEARAAIRAAEAALALARAELRRSRAEAEFAAADLNRTRALIRREVVPERSLELAEMELKTKEAAVASAEAALAVRQSELDRARARLVSVLDPTAGGGSCCIRLTSPVDGKVLRVLQESEAVVRAGTVLVEVGDPSRLEILVELLSSDAVQVREGAEVVIERWGGPISLKGRLRRVEPFGFTKVSALGIEEQRVNAIVDLVDPPEAWASLGHGFRVEVRILVWRGESVLQVPLSAIFRNGGEGAAWAVFKAESDRAVLQPIKIGRRNDRHVEVVEGLKAGDRVLAHPGSRIEDGVRIAERETELGG